jgi:hypothetical protein
MSHFGKKAVNFWDWDLYLKKFNKDNDTFKRWNQTPKETQLELLKKWYPIGMKGRQILVGSNKPSDLKIEITGYIEYIWGYQLDVDYVDSSYRKECHPVKFIPEPEEKNRILRELRLDKLLDQSI